MAESYYELADGRQFPEAKTERKFDLVIKNVFGNVIDQRDQVRAFLKRIEKLEGLEEIQAACRLGKGSEN